MTMFNTMSSSSSSSSSSVSPTAYHKPKFFTDFSIRALIGATDAEANTDQLTQALNYHHNHAIYSNTSAATSPSSGSQQAPLVGQDLRTRMATLAIGQGRQNTPATELTPTSHNHGHGQSQNPSPSQRKYRPKNFQCPACKMAFSNNGQLRTHVRIHTGERPFQCNHPDCNKTFTRNEELTRHKLIHTGVRPHSCATCGKRFGRKDHLKKHVKTHERKSATNVGVNSASRKDVFTIQSHQTTADFMNHHCQREAEAIFLFKDKLRKALEAQAKLEDLRI